MRRPPKRAFRGLTGSSPSSRSEMQGFEPVAIGIDDIGGEIVPAIVGADPRLAVVASARGERGGVKLRDALAIGGREADMQSRVRIVGDRRVCDADPKSDGLLAVAERVLAVAQPLVADRLERPVVERLRPGDVADADRDMVEHARVLLLLGRSADTARRPRHDPTWPLGWLSGENCYYAVMETTAAAT